MEGQWTHAICDSCWKDRHDKQPHRLLKPDEETCCYCGTTTLSGIYVRDDPRIVHKSE